MTNSVYAALSAQIALQRRLDTIANNVANASTVGFRAEQVRFATVASREALPDTAFPGTGRTYLTTSAGEVVRTDNPYDVAVDGDAWIAVQTAVGPALTRDGRMQVTATGELRTLTGYNVLDPGGTPILLSASDGPPQIGRDGSIMQGGRSVGSIGLHMLERGSRLSRGPDVTVLAEGQSTPLLDTSTAGLRQGFVEKANVNPVVEMSKLVLDQRLFEAVTSVVGDIQQIRQSALRILGGGS